MINAFYIAMAALFVAMWSAEFGRQLCGKSTLIEGDCQGERITGKTAGAVFCLAILFRVLLYVCGAVIYLMNSEATGFSLQEYLSCWNHWDGPHYLELAEKGYANCVENGQHLFLVFFPLYPWMVRIFHFFCRDWQAAGLLVSTMAYALGCAFFYACLAEEYGKDVAEKSLVLLSVSPFAFYFGAAMTESLFFCLISAAFFLIKRHRWLWAGIIGILCALCRAQGVIILGVGVVEFLVTYPPVRYLREKKLGEFLRHVFTKVIFLFLVPLGNLIYLGINRAVEGDPFRFVKYQREHWYMGPAFFTDMLNEISSRLLSETTANTVKACIWLPEFIAFFLAFLALYYGRKRHPLKYTAYLFVYVMVNYSVTWLISGGRYMLCAFPMYMIAGEFVHRHPRLYPWLIAVSSMLMTVYLSGYFTWRQVM